MSASTNEDAPPTSGTRAVGNAQPKIELFSRIMQGEVSSSPELQLVSNIMQTTTALSGLRMSILDMFSSDKDFGPYDYVRAHITLAILTDPKQTRPVGDDLRGFAEQLVEEETQSLAKLDKERMKIVSRARTVLQDRTKLLAALNELLTYTEDGIYSRTIWTSIYRAAFNVGGAAL